MLNQAAFAPSSAGDAVKMDLVLLLDVFLQRVLAPEAMRDFLSLRLGRWAWFEGEKWIEYSSDDNVGTLILL